MIRNISCHYLFLQQCLRIALGERHRCGSKRQGQRKQGDEEESLLHGISPFAKLRGRCLRSLLSPNDGWRYVPIYDGCQENTCGVVWCLEKRADTVGQP